MIYYLTLTVLFGLGFYNVYSDNKKVITQIFIICLCWLVLHDGLRWVIGTDWDNYYNYFRNCNLATNSEGDYFEIGYVLINKIIRSLTDQYSVFLVLHAAFIYTLLGITLYKYAEYPILSLAIFYALMLGYLGMNRQYIALAIQLYSLRFIINRQLYPFIGCMVLAMLFHNSAFIFFPVYFFLKPAKRIVYLSILSVFTLISLSGVMRKLPLELFYLLGSGVGDKADKYIYIGSDAVPLVTQILGMLKRMIWVVLPLIYFEDLKKVKNFPLFFNIYFLSLCVYLLFNNTIMQFFISRGALTYNLFEMFILPIILYLFKDNITRKIAFAFIFIYALLLMSKSINIYLELLGTDIFNPYRCILFE